MSYSILTHIIAKMTGMVPLLFVHSFGDAHVYTNHFDAVEDYLSQERHKQPTFKVSDRIKDLTDVNQITLDDFTWSEYTFSKKIKAPVAV